MIIKILNALLLLFQIGMCTLILTPSDANSVHHGTAVLGGFAHPYAPFLLPLVSAMVWGWVEFLLKRAQKSGMANRAKEKYEGVRKLLRLLTLWLMTATSFLAYCLYAGELYLLPLLVILMLLFVLLVGAVKYFSRS